MVFSVMLQPSFSAFIIPVWIQIGIAIAVLGISGWAAQVLPKHPKFQNITVALALAFVTAATLAQAAQIEGVVWSFFMECGCYFWWELCCYI